MTFRPPETSSKERQRPAAPAFRALPESSVAPTVLVQKEAPRAKILTEMFSTGHPRVDDDMRNMAHDALAECMAGKWVVVETGEEMMDVGINHLRIRIPKHSQAAVPQMFFDEWLKQKVYGDPNSKHLLANASCLLCGKSIRACGCNFAS